VSECMSGVSDVCMRAFHSVLCQVSIRFEQTPSEFFPVGGEVTA